MSPLSSAPTRALVALVALAGVGAAPGGDAGRSRGGTERRMETRSEDLLALVRALEAAQPFAVASVERALGTKLVAARGPREQAVLVSSGPPTTAFGLVLARVELRPGREATGTVLYLEISRSQVRHEHADPTFPGGGWSPPPPPGFRPPDAGPVYWVDRPWGLLGLAFRADGTLARVSCSVGDHTLPGI